MPELRGRAYAYIIHRQFLHLPQSHAAHVHENRQGKWKACGSKLVRQGKNIVLQTLFTKESVSGNPMEEMGLRSAAGV